MHTADSSSCRQNRGYWACHRQLGRWLQGSARVAITYLLQTKHFVPPFGLVGLSTRRPLPFECRPDLDITGRVKPNPTNAPNYVTMYPAIPPRRPSLHISNHVFFLARPHKTASKRSKISRCPPGAGRLFLAGARSSSEPKHSTTTS